MCIQSAEKNSLAEVSYEPVPSLERPMPEQTTMTVDSGDQSRSSSIAGPTLTHLQRHGSTASETARSGYSSSLYSSGYSSGYSSSGGGSAGLYAGNQQHHLGTTMSNSASAGVVGTSAGPDGYRPLFEEPSASSSKTSDTGDGSRHDATEAGNAIGDAVTAQQSADDECNQQESPATRTADTTSNPSSSSSSSSSPSSQPASTSKSLDSGLTDDRYPGKEKIRGALDSSPEKTRARENAVVQPQATPPPAQSRVKRIGRYLLPGQTLGKGNFARVEMAKHAQIQAKVAIKIIQTDKIKEEYVKRNLLRESAIMRQLKHPNIIHLYETMKTSTLYCIVTECAEGGELLQFVKNECPNRCMAEPLGRHFIRQLISALFHMHEHGIVHRDLKMENILLDKEKRNIKIIDFGLSNCHEPGEFLATHCGSPEYAAPELFVPGQVYGQEVDVWSLGVNMFAMLAGKLPFRVPKQGANRRRRLLDQISSGIGQQQEEESAHFSPSAMDLVRCLLQPDPSQRCNLRQAMLHPWITSDASQPLLPYHTPAENAASRDRIVDLMCARLDVQRSSVILSIKENKCDWMAAIFHLLNDQPATQTVLRDMNRTEVTSPSPPAAPAAAPAAAAARQSTAPAPTTAESQPAAPTSITAVMRKLEVAAGKPLTQTKGVQRHQSLGAVDRQRQNQTDGSSRDKANLNSQGSKPATQQQQSGASAQTPSRPAFRSRFSLGRLSNRQKPSAPSNQKSSSVPVTPLASPSAMDSPTERRTGAVVGSTIRSALENRSLTRTTRSLSSGAIPLTAVRHSQQQAIADLANGQHVQAAWSEGRKHSSLSPVRPGPGVNDPTASHTTTAHKKRPASAGVQRMVSESRSPQPLESKTTAAGEGGDGAEAVSKKKRSRGLFDSLRGKEKLAKSSSVDDIPHLKDGSEASKKTVAKRQAHLQMPANNGSLSRSFDLRPHAMATDGTGTPHAPHRPHTLQPRSSSYGDYFGQSVPQYELNMPWSSPVFPGYVSHGMDGSGSSPRRASARRHSSRNRGASMGDALAGYTSAYLQASPFGNGGDFHEGPGFYDSHGTMDGGRMGGHPAHFSNLAAQPRNRRASSGSVAVGQTASNSGKTFGLLRRSFRRKNSQP